MRGAIGAQAAAAVWGGMVAMGVTEEAEEATGPAGMQGMRAMGPPVRLGAKTLATYRERYALPPLATCHPFLTTSQQLALTTAT